MAKNLRSSVVATMMVVLSLGLCALEPARAIAAGGGAGGVLGLNDYLRQVRVQNQGYAAATEISEGAGLRSEEGSLAFRPNLTGSATFNKSVAEAALFNLPGTNNLYSLGISEQTRFGLQARLTYNLNYYSITGTPLAPSAPFYTAGPVLELSFPLLRNRFSAEAKAAEEAQNSGALAASFGQAFAAKAVLADAESAYWRLALARELVALSRETLSRAEKIQAWNLRRAKLELSDRSELLQAQAAVLSRQLELKSATDEEKAAARAFNSARGLDTDSVAEALVPISPEIMDTLAQPSRGGPREDLRSAEQQQKAAAASARLGQERAKPSVDLFASLSLNGNDVATSQAISESLTSQFWSRSVGVRMSVPLDFGTTSDIRAGYAREQAAADTLFERRAFEERRLWDDLSNRLSDTQARLKLARQIEDAQRQKLEFERQKLTRGRTTTYQVLLFEQDFIVAQLNRVRTQADLLNLVAQMKTFSPITQEKSS